MQHVSELDAHSGVKNVCSPIYPRIVILSAANKEVRSEPASNEFVYCTSIIIR